MKNSETALEYDIPHKGIADSTAQKPSKRAFLKRFADFRHPTPHHFSGAFKNCNAPIVQAQCGRMVTLKYNFAHMTFWVDIALIVKNLDSFQAN